MFLNCILFISLHFNLCLFFALENRPDVVQEVDYGKTAVLHCPSNDENHNFMFWQLADRKRSVIGPGNAYNKSKYEYEVLTGKLFIRAVSSEEEGILNCVSKGVRSDDISIRTVRMVVKKDWEEVFEDDPQINTLRVIVVMVSFIIIVGGGYFIYRSWKGNKQDMQLFLGEDDDDESNEELFSKPGPSHRRHLHSRSRTPSPSPPFRHSIDSTSFKSANSEINLLNLHVTNKTIDSKDIDRESKDIDPFDPFGDNNPNFNI